jgi:D-alanyl-D-alanine carboxypeptidase
VRTLSGYVSNTTTGRRIAFSVLVNNVPSGGDGSAKQFHEAVVEAVDDYLAEVSKATAGVSEK